MSDRRRILLIDDQQDILDLARTVLEGAGYEVEVDRSGSAALRRLARHRFDLVLLDISMPEMDGWETLRLMRADPSLGGTPVVMFSVKDELDDKVQGLQEGALDYITKPFEVDELLLRVRRIFEAPAPQATGAPPRQGAD